MGMAESAKIASEVNELKRWFDNQEWQPGQAISFDRTLGVKKRKYTYVALYTPKGWYITGYSGKISPENFWGHYLSSATNVRRVSSSNTLAILNEPLDDLLDFNDLSTDLDKPSTNAFTDDEVRTIMADDRNYNVAGVKKRAQNLIEKHEEYKEKRAKLEVEAIETALEQLKSEENTNSFEDLRSTALYDALEKLENEYSHVVRQPRAGFWERFIENLDLLEDDTIQLTAEERTLLGL